MKFLENRDEESIYNSWTCLIILYNVCDAASYITPGFHNTWQNIDLTCRLWIVLPQLQGESHFSPLYAPQQQVPRWWGGHLSRLALMGYECKLGRKGGMLTERLIKDSTLQENKVNQGYLTLNRISPVGNLWKPTGTYNTGVDLHKSHDRSNKMLYGSLSLLCIR